MDRFAQFVRLTTACVLASILGIAHTTVDPVSLRAQQEEDCIESLGPCVDLRHHYDGQCEGSICYTELEMCCLEDIVVR